MKYYCVALLLLVPVLCVSQMPTGEGVKRIERGGLSAESLELAMLKNFLAQELEQRKNALLPHQINWSDVWNSNEFVHIWSKTFLVDPWERYYFLDEAFQMPAAFENMPSDGWILLVKAKPSDLKARGDSTTKDGLWWDLIVVTNMGRIRNAQLPFAALPSRDGQIALRLKSPNIPVEKVQEYHRHLQSLGAVASDKSGSSDASSPQPSAQSPTTKAREPKAALTGEQPTALSPWLVMIVAAIGLLLLFLKKRK